MQQLCKQLKYILCFIPIFAVAQNDIKGKVLDSDTSDPLPIVNILNQNTGNGALTDFDGNFILEGVSMNDVLLFSYIGYTPKEVTYKGETDLTISLKASVSNLQEVVLIGYGSASKKDVTAAVAKVSAKDFNQGAIISPEQLIAAKTPGVRVTTAGGAPGTGSRIRIRGGASLSASSDPLIVVDGIPLDQGNELQGTRNPLNAINPNEINDFVILKDAAATAIYGSRGSNGVILINTKKGRKNTPWELSLDVKGSYGFNNEGIDVLSADEYRQFVADFDSDPANAGNLKSQFLRNANTDWQDEIFQNGYGIIYDATVSKGFKNTILRLNSNTNIQQGALRTDEYRRSSWNLALTQFLLDNDLKITVTSKNSFGFNRFANNKAINAALSFNPTNPIYDPNNPANFFEERDAGGNLLVNAPGNPLGILLQDRNTSDNTRSITNVALDYKIKYVPGLRFNLNTGFDYGEAKNGRQFQPANTGINKLPFDNIKTYSGINRNQLLDFYFNYKKDINRLNTTVDITAGYSYQSFFESKYNSETNNGELVALSPEINTNKLIGYLGRASFDIANKYLISGSIRRDLSSRFSEDNRVGYFPGASVGWKLHNENFLKDSNVLSQLKLRAGWGITGQQEISENYAFLSLITPSDTGAFVQFGDQFIQTNRIEAVNEDLKWEETTSFNIGMDFGFLRNRISGSIEYYTRDTDDLLATVPVPAGTNTSDFLTVNAASTTSEGIEFLLNATIIDKKDFSWNAGFNITYSTREIEQLNLSNDPDFFVPQGGISGGVGNTVQIWKPGYDPTTFFTFRQIYDDEGNPIEGAYVDVNGDNQISEADRIASKKATPDFLAGFTSTFTYKAFDLNMTWRGSFGGYNYNNAQSILGNIASSLNNSGDFIQNTTSDFSNTNFQNAQFFSDYYLEKSDFVKLDNITLGYNIDNQKMKWRFSVTANNLWTITNYSGIDPEVFVTDVISQREGIDDSFYPRQTSLIFGVNLKF
ncbi:TonB-dependent receptor [Aquimarina addita]|uniref:TonB-dependent receptor n=1 Tax=Aquimarina addita TaxID=870485 RepID=A0ABP6UU41_9FLAO